MNCEECRKQCKEDGETPPCECGYDCFQDALEDIEEW